MAKRNRLPSAQGLKHAQAYRDRYRKQHNLTPLQCEYEDARETTGVTVQEFESERGMEPYTVYPDCKDIKERDVGYFMYCNAPDHDTRMQNSSGRGGIVFKEGFSETNPFKGLTKYNTYGKGRKHAGKHWSKGPMVLPKGA